MKTFLMLFLILKISAVSAMAQSPIVPILEMRLGGLIGGVQNGKFVDTKTAFGALKGKRSYTIYGARGRVGELTAEIEAPEIPCEQFYPATILMPDISGIAIAANPGWRVSPRTAKSIDIKNAVYLKAVSDVLKTKGITAGTANITQAYRVDLEGDGQDEVVLTATSYKGNMTPKAKKGDYSFVMLRKIVGGKARNIVLSGDFITRNIDFGAPNKYEISSIADLNGDGKMEIVTFGEYYEGQFAEAFEITENKAIKVLQTGCGV